MLLGSGPCAPQQAAARSLVRLSPAARHARAHTLRPGPRRFGHPQVGHSRCDLLPELAAFARLPLAHGLQPPVEDIPPRRMQSTSPRPLVLPAAMAIIPVHGPVWLSLLLRPFSRYKPPFAPPLVSRPSASTIQTTSFLLSFPRAEFWPHKTRHHGLQGSLQGPRGAC